MKKLLFILLISTLFACTDDSEPDILTAQVVVHQWASQTSTWNSALVTADQDINTVQTIRTSGFHGEYANPIQPNEPFALIFDVEEFGGQLSILMKISEKDVKNIIIPEALTKREVYIHPNGNLPAAQALANSITFDATIIILE